jgi:deoxyribose-phosphate aldolase
VEKNVRTDSAAVSENCGGLFLSPKEALEYCNFKREKFRAEVMRAVAATTVDIRAAGGGEEEKRLLAAALKHKTATVTLTGNRLPYALPNLSPQSAADVWIGGDGNAHIKAKFFELKTALRMGAKEATVAIDPHLILEEKFSEIKKRTKRLKAKAKKTPLKLGVVALNAATGAKLYRIAAECGVGFSVPYFKGVERLKTESGQAAFLQVTGVATVADFKRLKEAGVDRIGAVDLDEIYAALIKEAEECAISVPLENMQNEKDLNNSDNSAALYRAVIKDEIK